MKKCLVMTIAAALLLPMTVLFAGSSDTSASLSASEKKAEIDTLEVKLMLAKKQVNEASRLHGRDFLQLLPSVSVSRRSTSEMVTDSSNETYIGFAVNSSQLWNITDRYSARDTAISTTLRKIESCGFLIRKLIDRKFLFKDRLWKFQQIRSSLSNPVEMAAMDEKIDEMIVKVQECEIDIEKTYAEMEYASAEVDR